MQEIRKNPDNHITIFLHKYTFDIGCKSVSRAQTKIRCNKHVHGSEIYYLYFRVPKKC